MKKVALFLILFTVFSCDIQHDYYKNYYKQDENYLKRRVIETRSFEIQNEEQILSASANVLQDLGFILNETNVKIGLITATKTRSAATIGAKVAQAVITGYLTNNPTYDTEREFYVTLVSTKNNNGGYNVRVTFASITYDNQNGRYVKLISNEPEYQVFFNKLGQSLFLTSHNI